MDSIFWPGRDRDIGASAVIAGAGQRLAAHVERAAPIVGIHDRAAFGRINHMVTLLLSTATRGKPDRLPFEMIWGSLFQSTVPGNDLCKRRGLAGALASAAVSGRSTAKPSAAR